MVIAAIIIMTAGNFFHPPNSASEVSKNQGGNSEAIHCLVTIDIA